MITKLQVYIRAKPVTLIDFIAALLRFCVRVCILGKNEYYFLRHNRLDARQCVERRDASRPALLFNFRRMTLDDYRNNVERGREC